MFTDNVPNLFSRIIHCWQWGGLLVMRDHYCHFKCTHFQFDLLIKFHPFFLLIICSCVGVVEGSPDIPHPIPGAPRGIPRPYEMFSFSSVLWVYHWAPYQWDARGKFSNGRQPRAHVIRGLNLLNWLPLLQSSSSTPISLTLSPATLERKNPFLSHCIQDLKCHNTKVMTKGESWNLGV